MNIPNKKYWIDRSVQLEQAIQENAEPAIKTIQDAYVEAVKHINADMKSVVRGLSKASGITEDEAQKLLNEKESCKQYKDLIKLYDETEDELAKKDIALKINHQAYGARMTRLEELKQNVYKHLMRAQNTELAQHKALHAETLQRSYYSNIHNIAKGFDVGINFAVLPKKAIDKALSAKWLGSNYSKRIWNNNTQFIDKVQRTITDGITAGHSIDRMANKLLDYVRIEGTGQRYVAERLARTETAHFMAEGQLEAYREAGIEKYQFVAALAENTCIDCGNMDGEIILVSEARAGDNYPPIHANCRCTTVLAGYPSNTRIARDPITGKNYKVDGNMTYNEWVKGLTSEQKQAMELHVRQMKNKSADMKQYEKYIKVLGAENMPKTFDKFRETKYNDNEKYDELKHLYREVNWQVKAQNNLTQGSVHTVPPTAEPNSVFDNYGKDGALLQRRYYGITGKPRLDIDMTDHNNSAIHKVVPHYHNWTLINQDIDKWVRDKEYDKALEKWHIIANKDILKGDK